MRIEEFRNFLISKGIDACILIDRDPNIFYFAGIELEHCLFVITRSSSFFIASELESERIFKYSKIKKIFSYKTYAERKSLIAKNLKPKVIGINKAEINMRDFEFFSSIFPSAKFDDINEELVMLRQVKTKEEIENIREACFLTDKILEKCIGGFDFRTELELRNFLESEIRNRGFKPSFEPIVASGINSSIPHYSVFSGKLKGFCVIDFGIKFNGYCSDVTRTIYIGSPKKGEMEVYDVVRSSQEAALCSIKEGISAGELDSISRRIIGRYRKNFIHGLGHQLGIEVHDVGFRISHYEKGILMENMVVTIEPGVYFKGKFGIRIEDDVLVRKDGFEVLSKFSKNLVVVKR